jgi:transcriptional regulator with PAS, ATPase and Fis domain
MKTDIAEDKQPWVSCFLTDILLSHLEETLGGKTGIDYASLFREAEGFEAPTDPELFLKDINNWIPLAILRELLWQCERISGKKDIAYHAAKAYFDPGKNDLLSVFKILFQVLNDVRSVVICSNLWAAVQTNYLKLQSFEGPGSSPSLFLLAQFGEYARPAVGSMQLVRGLCEGSPRLYSLEEVHCIEEISQLRIEDIVREFPDYAFAIEENRLDIRHRSSLRTVAQATKIPLASEVILLSPDFWIDLPDAVVVPPQDGRIQVLSNAEETNPQRRPQAAWVYRIVKPGILTAGNLSYAFEEGQVLNAPYSRYRLLWNEVRTRREEVSVEDVRREVSQLLFEHLKQVKQTQTRMIQYGIEKRNLALENIHLRREIDREYGLAGIVGRSLKMRELFGVVRSISETDVVAMIYGETGTGKELIARAIHYNSLRRAKRFVAVNCGALAETLLESELFGHEKGAFTGAATRRRGIFEIADGGTLFLDEVGEISVSTQVRLLRVLQEGEFQRVGGTESIRVDVRILSATNQNLEELVRRGRFRQDLYYRLNVFPVRIPALRERADDIPLLVAHFIEKYNQRMNRHIARMDPRTMALLVGYPWAGNVRELENVIQRMMVVAKGDTLDLDTLPKEIRGDAEDVGEKARDLKDLTRGSAEIVEKRAIQDALSASAGNVTRTAKALGISRATLQKRMKAYSLREPRE